MRSTNLYGMSKRKWPELDSLFFKFQGPTPAALKETAAIVQRIAKKHGGSGFELAKTDKEATDLWADRKNALYSGLALVPGSRGWSTDVWYVVHVFLTWTRALMMRFDDVQCARVSPAGFGV